MNSSLSDRVMDFRVLDQRTTVPLSALGVILWTDAVSSGKAPVIQLTTVVKDRSHSNSAGGLGSSLDEPRYQLKDANFRLFVVLNRGRRILSGASPCW